MFKKLWMYNTRPALDIFAGRRVRFDNGSGGGGEGGAGGSGGDGGDGGEGGDDKPTVESLNKIVADMKAAHETYKSETNTKVSGLISDLQKEREKSKPKENDDDDDNDGDKTFLTKAQTAALVKEAVEKATTGLVSAYSDDKLGASVDSAKIKYTKEKGEIPYSEVIEKGFVEFAKKNPGLITAMKTAQDPAEFAYLVGIAHPVFAARRKAKVKDEIAEEMKKPKPTKIAGADGKTEVTPEAVGDMSPDEWEKLPEATKHAMLYGSKK